MDEAEELFKKALEEQGQGHWQAAGALYRAILGHHPGLAAVSNNLAVCLTEQGLAHEALPLLEPLAQNPAAPEVLTNLGNAYRSLGRFAEAERAYAAVVNALPMDARAASNLALVCQDQGKMTQAVQGFERAVALAPGDSSIRANLGGALLMSGDFAKGWPAYEFRLAGGESERAMRLTGLPLWDGAPLKGRRLLVWTEQGLGDTLQFLRFLPKLGGPVTVMAQGALWRLIQGIEGVAAVYGWNDAPPAADLQVALLSLARLAGCTSEARIPPPCLKADPLLAELWGKRLAGLKGLRIGLSWQGNPAMKADAVRSAPLIAFKPLFALPGISWVSLQTGPGREQLAALRSPLLDLGDEISDLADTAAIMSHLDLVISVDSAVGHLAGSLNRPVWIMVRANPDWRWRPGAVDSPWYPMARLWRQPALGDWRPVIAAMSAKLATYPPGPS